MSNLWVNSSFLQHSKAIFQILGYWTDNGAFYYYNTLGENTTYEDTLLELNDYFTQERNRDLMSPNGLRYSRA